MAEKIHRNSLKPGYKLHWYEIREVLGQGGFGITYLAQDTNLDKLVAIKEYLPIELAVRERDSSVHPITEDRGKNYQWGLARFINEARTLSQFSHPNIVRVYAVFEENNTAYMVMEYEHGESLQSILTRRKTLEEAELLSILIPIVGGLDLVHQAGFIHRDIKPANIFIRKDGSPVLLDFGSARQAMGEQIRTLTSLVSPGYAPFEQYYSKSDAQGPWTDIYGLGATLYRAVAGIAPMDAVDRSKAILEKSKDLFVPAVEIGKGKYSERFLRAIDHALKFKPDDRPQSLVAWKAAFGVKEDLAEIKRLKIMEHAATQPGTRVVTRPSKHLRPVTITLFLVLAGGVVAFYYQEAIQGVIQTYLTETKAPELIKDMPSPEELATKKVEEEDRRKREEEINQLLVEAENAFTAGQYLEPPANNALEYYLRVLDIDPMNAAAQQGKQRVFDHFLQLAQTQTEEQQFETAERALLKADIVEPGSRAIRLARLRLQEKKTEAERIAMEEERIRREEEQKQKAEEEAKQLAGLEKQRQEEESRKKAEEEQRRLEEEKRKEQERLAEAERIRREEEARKKAEDEKKEKYNLLIAEAGEAVSNRDKELAISKYQEVLALYPGDPVAETGLKEAEKLMDKSCLDIVGDWNVDWARSRNLKFTFNSNKTGKWHEISHNDVKWNCTDPVGRKFQVILQSNVYPKPPPKEWTITISTDGNSFSGKAPGDYTVEGKKITSSSSLEKKESGNYIGDKGIDVCSEIVGIWKWSDLAGTISRFYEDGKVVSKNILKSEGTWECVDSANRLFTFNTWNKKREITLNEDYRQLQSVGLFGEKLSATKISDNPEEEIAPAQKSGTDIPRL